MIRILTIGNSFAENATDLLPQMIAADGDIELMIGYCNLGGCSLEKHCNVLRQCELFPEVRPYDFSRSGKETIPATLLEALQAEAWDYVTMQQASHLSWQPESYEPFFGQLLAQAREHAPQAQPIMHQTWAYRVDAPFFAEQGIDQSTMHEGINDSYQAMAQSYGLPLIPVGQAWVLARAQLAFRPDPHFDYDNPAPGALPDATGSLNAGWKWVTGNTADGNAEFCLDAGHCSELGRYLGAAVWYERFTGRSIHDNAYRPDGMSEDTLELLRNAAQGALAEVTDCIG